ncbi:hypothetical protein AB4Z52_26675 [Rhizobium sp. 2YAF20]|uniref:hypothetical protein n=1 Tax=Rhizobium sp. 2YAF20 TaxID=3233027 RepID=UPI003F97AA94
MSENSFSKQLQADGFCIRPAYHTVLAIGEFAWWLINAHGDGVDVHEGSVVSFMERRVKLPDYRYGTRIALTRLVAGLRRVL